eukprot:15460309-Alexandrium_andersonii.AAC.1
MLGTFAAVRSTRVLSTRMLRAEHALADYSLFGLHSGNVRAESVPRTLRSAPLRAGCVPGSACYARACS